MLTNKLQKIIDLLIEKLNNGSPFNSDNETQFMNVEVQMTNMLNKKQFKHLFNNTFDSIPLNYDSVFLIKIVYDNKNYVYSLLVCESCSKIYIMDNNDITQTFEIKDALKPLLDLYKSLKNVNEMSVTGNVAGYNTPFAFSDNEAEKNKRIKKGLKSTGYTIVKEDFREDNYQPTARQQIFDKLSEINAKLFELEKIMTQVMKIKNEQGIKKVSDTLKNKINKIDKRVDYIKQEIKHFNT